MPEKHWEREVAPDGPTEATSIPILPARDIPETLALYERLGFTVHYDQANEYAMARRGAIEVHFVAAPDLDPWGGEAGMAYVRLPDVDRLYEEFITSAALPLMPGPASELSFEERTRDELHARWEAGESIARMGQIADKPWGIREFPLLDCNNNLIRFGRVID
ncbi:MAG TPA: VOC family protein [Acidimicrobiales bacterium]